MNGAEKRTPWLFSDPQAPTRDNGGVLDGILLYPGGYVPVEMFPQGGTGRGEEDEHEKDKIRNPAMVSPQ